MMLGMLTLLLLGLALCALGWLRESRRLATARREAQAREQHHRIMEARVAVAEQTARFGIWAWDPASGAFSLSEGAAAINGLGDKAVDVTGDDLHRVHPDDRASMIR